MHLKTEKHELKSAANSPLRPVPHSIQGWKKDLGWIWKKNWNWKRTMIKHSVSWIGTRIDQIDSSCARKKDCTRWSYGPRKNSYVLYQVSYILLYVFLIIKVIYVWIIHKAFTVSLNWSQDSYYSHRFGTCLWVSSKLIRILLLLIMHEILTRL